MHQEEEFACHHFAHAPLPQAETWLETAPSGAQPGCATPDLGKPIVAIANSFTEFVPHHVHLRNLGKVASDSVAMAGGVAKEFNTIAVDDGDRDGARRHAV